MVEIFRSNIVDVSPDSVIIEVTGDVDKVDSLLRILRPFGVREVMRTGRVGLMRGIARSLALDNGQRPGRGNGKANEPS